MTHASGSYSVKRRAFAREVVLHRLVVVKMILREVAECSHPKMRSPDTPEIERVTRDLACTGIDMCVDHPGKELLEIT